MVSQMKVLNDILGYDLKIYQNSNFFCFSIDSVILANFPRIKLRTKRIVDLGTGNGVIPLILSRRTKCFIDGIEIQEDLSNLAKESVLYNQLENQIHIYNMDMKDFVNISENNGHYDIVVANPPYFKCNDLSVKNIDIHKAIARHEIMITLEEVVESAFKLLKERGYFATVNRVDRFMEVLNLLRKYKLEPKYIRFIYDNIECRPNLFYIEGMKGASSGLIIDKPFVMYDTNHKETAEYKKLKEEVCQ